LLSFDLLTFARVTKLHHPFSNFESLNLTSLIYNFYGTPMTIKGRYRRVSMSQVTWSLSLQSRIFMTT